ncbi:MAG: hypothetical protein ABW352_06580 [Polyangiales bacterium]
MRMLRPVGTLLVLLFLGSLPGAASAQTARVLLAPELLVGRLEVGPLEDPTLLRHQQRRGSALIMVGSGLLAAAAVHAAVFAPRTYCYSYDEPNTRLKTPPIAAGVATGLALGLLVGGILKLTRVPRQFRRSHPSRITGFVLGALASGLVSSALLYAVSAPEILSCS